MFVLKSRSHTIKRSLVLLAVSFFLVSNGEASSTKQRAKRKVCDRRLHIKLNRRSNLKREASLSEARWTIRKHSSQ